VTGAGSGFGLSMVKQILKSGEKVVATLRKPEVLSALQKEYSQAQLLVLKLDVTKPNEVSESFKTAREHFGRVDVVFNNAGTGCTGEFESITEQNAREVFEVRASTHNRLVADSSE
jgi:NAD(P)-dependent dehydrogenase (short-subunit alcohol dehydrogenase family)